MSDTQHRRRFLKLQVDRVDFVRAGANEGAHITLFKSAPATLEVDQVTDPVVEAPEAPVEEVAMPEETPVETVAKADFEALQKQLADEAEARNVSVEKAAALEARIHKMEREQKQAEFVAKARDLSNLGEANTLGAVLLEVADGVSEDTYKSLETLLKAANAQMETGALFVQFGKQDDDDPVDVVDRITALAKAKVDTGAAPTLQIAKLQVIQEHPELKSEYSSARSAI